MTFGFPVPLILSAEFLMTCFSTRGAGRSACQKRHRSGDEDATVKRKGRHRRDGRRRRECVLAHYQHTRWARTDEAQNWPFLMLITFPVFPAATKRSVWRHRNAGICMTSATWLQGHRDARVRGNAARQPVSEMASEQSDAERNIARRKKNKTHPTGSAWCGSWMSVTMGTSKVVLTACRICGRRERERERGVN